jgi:hypothetical protein
VASAASSVLLTSEVFFPSCRWWLSKEEVATYHKQFSHYVPPLL